MFLARWVGFRPAWSGELVVKIGIVVAMTFLEAPPPGLDVPWSGCVGAANAPVASHLASRFIAPIVVAGSAKNRARLPRVSRPAANMPREVGPTPNLHLIFKQKKSFGTFFPAVQFQFRKFRNHIIGCRCALFVH